MSTQFLSLVFFWLRFLISLSLTPLRFQAFQRMNRSLTQIPSRTFSMRWSTIAFTIISWQVSFTFNSLQVSTLLVLILCLPLSLHLSKAQFVVLTEILLRVQTHDTSSRCLKCFIAICISSRTLWFVSNFV